MQITEDEPEVDYRAAIQRAVGSAYDDKWAERTEPPNSGPRITADRFKIDPDSDFVKDFGEMLNERYGG